MRTVKVRKENTCKGGWQYESSNNKNYFCFCVADYSCLYVMCKILNKIYSLIGGILTVVFMALFLIVSIGYKDMQQSIFLVVLEGINVLILIVGNTVGVLLEVALEELTMKIA